jgi:hypothetical protein
MASTGIKMNMEFDYFNSRLREDIHDIITYKECNFFNVIALMEAF